MRYLILAMALALPSGGLRAEGAIAHGSNGRIGLSVGWGTWGLAQQKALADCDGCRIVRLFSHACASVAVGDGLAFGWATRDSLANSDQGAIASCAASGGTGCVVESHGCDRM